MKILKEQKQENILFIDIETIRIIDELKQGTELYDSWDYKMRYSKEADEKFEIESLQKLFKEKAALYPEFGKIVCITLGKINGEKLIIKSYSDEDEQELLINFINDLSDFTDTNKFIKLCGHSIIGFDLPYIMRRCIINDIPLHSYLDTAHLKPWEINFVLDISNLWKGTGFYPASLLNISTALGLKSSKNIMSGSETSDVFYNEENGLTKITEYCVEDVIVTANIFKRLRGESIINDIKIL